MSEYSPLRWNRTKYRATFTSAVGQLQMFSRTLRKTLTIPNTTATSSRQLEPWAVSQAQSGIRSVLHLAIRRCRNGDVVHERLGTIRLRERMPARDRDPERRSDSDLALHPDAPLQQLCDAPGER